MVGPIESTSLRSRSEDHRGLYTPEDGPSQAAADVNAVDANESTVNRMERIDNGLRNSHNCNCLVLLWLPLRVTSEGTHPHNIEARLSRE